MSRLSPLVAPALETADHGQPIAHGFFTRQGGVSQGLYQSLNVGQVQMIGRKMSPKIAP